MSDLELRIGSALARALEKKGYDSLTRVQEAVLDSGHVGRDLRISSQTGSGKTLAVGFLLRDSVEAWAEERERPCALVIAPTRELAKQFEAELRWLYAEVPASIVSLTGGASYRDELRALNAKPAIVVGTPGRVLDHLNRKSFDASGLGAIVLDEADRMLDMGFKEELEQIFDHAKEGHRTHLVSATFPREVKALADKVQDDPIHVEGTPLGAANADIDHVMYVVDSKDRLAAVINLLIATRGGRSLIFVRTREAVANLSRALTDAGFRIESISGDLQQAARNKALAAFKRGEVDALVATDVAARGIDVTDLARVIHADPPGDADTYTHRSGRTGRAGKKGESAILLVPPGVARMQFMLKRARVVARFGTVPDAESLRKDADEALYAELTGDAPADHELGDRAWHLATKLGAAGEVKRVVARLLAKSLNTRGIAPREVRNITPRDGKRNERPARDYDDRPRRDYDRPVRDYERERPVRDYERPVRKVAEERPSRAKLVEERPSKRKVTEERPSRAKLVEERPSKRKVAEERPSRAKLTEERPSKRTLVEERPSKRGVSEERDTVRDLRKAAAAAAAREAPEAPARPKRSRADVDHDNWVPFRVTWGSLHGADPRRLVAMLCRRGNIEGTQIGSIKIAPTFSTVMVDGSVAEEFASAASEKDERNPKVAIRPDRGEPEARSYERPAPERRERPTADRYERPRADGPSRYERPRADGPSRYERPRADAPVRKERPRADGPTVERPRVERPRADGPRVERPRAERSDRRPSTGKPAKKTWKKK